MEGGLFEWKEGGRRQAWQVESGLLGKQYSGSGAAVVQSRDVVQGLGEIVLWVAVVQLLCCGSFGGWSLVVVGGGSRVLLAASVSRTWLRGEVVIK